MSFRTKTAGSKSGLTLSGTRYSARGVALCLSFFLAACSGNAVREGAGDNRAQALQNLRIAAVGDIMLGSDFPEDRLPADDVHLLQAMAGDLQQADITFGNLEASLLNGGEPAKSCVSPQSCYLFRTPGRLIDAMTREPS